MKLNELQRKVMKNRMAQRAVGAASAKLEEAGQRNQENYQRQIDSLTSNLLEVVMACDVLDITLEHLGDLAIRAIDDGLIELTAEGKKLAN